MKLFRFEGMVSNHIRGTLPYSSVSFDFEVKNSLEIKKMASQHAKKFAPILKDKRLRWKLNRIGSRFELGYDFEHLAPHGKVRYQFRVYEVKNPSPPVMLKG